MMRIAACPDCDSPEVRQVCRTVSRRRGGQEFRIPRVRHWECPDCGHRFFGPEAMQKMESWLREKAEVA